MSKVPFVDLAAQYRRLKPQIDAGIQRVLDHGRFIMGPEVVELESALSAFAGCRHAVSCASGTDALVMALMAQGVGPGHAVFLPSFTFPASTEVILIVGATPVFVEVDPRSFNLDPDHLREKVDSTRRAGLLEPKAIIPVDLFGLPADHGEIAELADQEDLFVIADAAQSFGARIGEARVGTHAPVTTTSFFPAKPLGCFGDGGAVTTNDEDVAIAVSRLRYNGEDRETGEYHYHGYTALLDNVQAAVLDVKLRHLMDWIEHRRHIASLYREGLEGIDDLVLPHFGEERHYDNFQNYVVRTSRRDELRAHLEEQGVETLYHWPKPMWEHEALELENPGLPGTEAICREVVSLPMSAETTEEHVEVTVNAVRKFFELQTA